MERSRSGLSELDRQYEQRSIYRVAACFSLYCYMIIIKNKEGRPFSGHPTFKPKRICQDLIFKAFCLTIYYPRYLNDSTHNCYLVDSVVDWQPLSLPPQQKIFLPIGSGLGDKGTSKLRATRFKASSTRVQHGLQFNKP